MHLVDLTYGNERTRNAYPSDVSDDKWAFVVPSLMLMPPNTPQRHHDLRAPRSASVPCGHGRTG